MKVKDANSTDFEIMLASQYFHAQTRGFKATDKSLIAKFKKMTATFPARLKAKRIEHQTIQRLIGLNPTRLWRRFTNNNWQNFEETAGMIEILNSDVHVTFKLPKAAKKQKPKTHKTKKKTNKPKHKPKHKPK